MESPLPKTWREAAPYIVWGVLIFAAGFEGVVTLVSGEWRQSIISFALMAALTAIVIHWRMIAESMPSAGATTVLLAAIISAFHDTELGIPNWVPIALILLAAVLGTATVVSGWRTRTERPKQQPSSRAGTLVPQDIFWREDLSPKITYHYKIYIVVRNDSSKDIIVSPARWRSNADGVAVSPLREESHPWSPEGSGGWQNESYEGERRDLFRVPAGRVIKTWIGVSAPISADELRRRTVRKRIGTLIVPVTIDGHTSNEEIDL